MARHNFFVLAVAVAAFVAISCPTVTESARIKRQIINPPLNLASVISALNLTSYLQGATAQIQQDVATLVTELQSQVPAIQAAVQSALQGLTGSTQTLALNLQLFLINLETQLAVTGTTVSTDVTNAINQLQAFLSLRTFALQQLINAVGSNIANGVQTLQSDIAALNTFLQAGLNNLTTHASQSVQASITTLQNSLNSGALNQTLATVVAQLNGQAVNLQAVLIALQGQVGISLILVINSILFGLQSLSATLLQTLVTSVTLLVSPN